MKQSTYKQLKEFGFPNSNIAKLFENKKQSAISAIKKMNEGGIPLTDIYVNDYQKDGNIKLIVNHQNKTFVLENFNEKSINKILSENNSYNQYEVYDIEWNIECNDLKLPTELIVSAPINLKDDDLSDYLSDAITNETECTNNGFRFKKIGKTNVNENKFLSSKFKILMDNYGINTIYRAINESKYIDFKQKRNIIRCLENKNYEPFFENIGSLSILESKTFSGSDIKSLLSDYFGESTNLSLNNKMITDFNDRYGLMIKNSGKFEQENMNFLLDEWFNYWSQNGLISKSDIKKAEDRKLDNKESEVPNDIKNFFRTAGYQYVGHNKKFKIYTYSIGLGKDDPNFITATLDMADKTLRLLNLNQKDIIQSADDLSSIKLPTNLSEFNTLLTPDMTKENIPESIKSGEWETITDYANMEYLDGEDIYDLLCENGLCETYWITIFDSTIEDFNRKFQEYKIKINAEDALQAALDYLQETWFDDILEKKQVENEIGTEFAELISSLDETEIQDIYLYLYSKDRPYSIAMKNDIIAYFEEYPDDEQSKNYILNLVNA